MRRLWKTLLAPLALLPVAGPAGAQVTALDAAAQALKTNPVYIDGAAERARDVDADRVRARIRRGDAPIFVAVLPASAVTEAGVDVSRLPEALAQKAGLRGTYAVVAGSSFRADSNDIASSLAQRLATAAFQARSGDGVGAVLDNFIDRVNEAATGAVDPAPSGASAGREAEPAGDSGGGSGGAVLVLLLLGGGAFFWWSRSRRRKQRAADAKDFQADRQLLQAELSVLGHDVLDLEPQVTLHADARADYDAGVTRYQSAVAAMEYADDQVDLVRVKRVVDEGRYAMARAKAHVEGREPPPPPEPLTRPGRHDEPAMALDDRGAPVYVGQGNTQWYGGGWFGGGGGGGLLTGLLLGGMLGGGWGGGWAGHGHEDSGDSGGGDAGDGGGDWGGGDFGGGDFGGGDFGGGGDF